MLAWLLANASYFNASVAAQSLDVLAELVRAGHDADALETIARLPSEERSAPKLRYLRARLLERIGRTADAVGEFAAVSSTPLLPPRARDDAAQRALDLMLSLGKCRDATAWRAAVGRQLASAGDSLADAECWIRSGDVEHASAVLERIERRGGATARDARLRRLELAIVSARPPAAAQLLSQVRALLTEDGLDLVSDRARAVLETHGVRVSLSRVQHLARARRFASAARHEEALRELVAAGRPLSRRDLPEYLHDLGMALFRTRTRYAEASQVLFEAARLGGATAGEDEFHAIRALSRSGRDADAISRYRRFARRHPSHPRAYEARYLAAWLELRLGSPAGVASMQAVVDGARGPAANSAHRSDAMWALAFARYDRGETREASALLRQLAERSRDALSRARGSYWLARSLERDGFIEPAIRAFRDAMRPEPLGWYALLARQRLVGLNSDPGDPFGDAATDPAPAPRPVPPPVFTDDVVFFSSLGLDRDAAALFDADAAAGVHAPTSRREEWAVRALTALHAHHEAYERVRRRSNAELASRPTASTRWIWQAAYPRPQSSQVRALEQELELPADLVFAHMRQESGYRSTARSRAGALGLLQLMPETARRVARRRGKPNPREEDLLSPGLNVELGAAYLGGLLRAFGEALPLAIPAYNAGAERVRTWVEGSRFRETDRFVEDIPFTETRNYVRRVVGHLARYRYLANPLEPWPLWIPERVDVVPGSPQEAGGTPASADDQPR